MSCDSYFLFQGTFLSAQTKHAVSSGLPILLFRGLGQTFRGRQHSKFMFSAHFSLQTGLFRTRGPLTSSWCAVVSDFLVTNSFYPQVTLIENRIMGIMSETFCTFCLFGSGLTPPFKSNKVKFSLFFSS